MVDLFGLLASVSSLAYLYFATIIRRRLKDDDGARTARSLFVLDQPRNLKRYWELAHNRQWSRGPVFGACITFLCGLASCAVLIALLFHRPK